MEKQVQITKGLLMVDLIEGPGGRWDSDTRQYYKHTEAPTAIGKRDTARQIVRKILFGIFFIIIGAAVVAAFVAVAIERGVIG
jgi:hypothetical protein